MGTSTSFLPEMKAILGLVIVASVSAQRGLKGLFQGDRNPCGAGVKPTSITCPDGTVFDKDNRPSRGKGGPCGECVLPTSITCPDGSSPSVGTDRSPGPHHLLSGSHLGRNQG